MKLYILIFAVTYFTSYSSKAQTTDSLFVHHTDSLLPHSTDSLLIYCVDSLLLKREKYLIKHLKLSTAQAKEIKDLHQAFSDYKRRTSTLEVNGNYKDMHIIRQQEEELKKILTENQYEQLKNERENAQKIAIENYYKELEKEKALQQKKKPQHK